MSTCRLLKNIITKIMITILIREIMYNRKKKVTVK